MEELENLQSGSGWPETENEDWVEEHDLVHRIYSTLVNMIHEEERWTEIQYVTL